MDKYIDELLRRNNNDARACLAWVIGYINRLENQLNEVRSATGNKEVETLICDMKRELSDK